MFWVARILKNFLGCSKFLIFIFGRTVYAGPEPTYEEKMRVPPPSLPSPSGLKRLVPNYYFAFSCHPLGALVRFPCWGHNSFYASLSQQNVQKNSKALVREMSGVGGWGLKFKKNARKNKAHT